MQGEGARFPPRQAWEPMVFLSSVHSSTGWHFKFGPNAEGQQQWSVRVERPLSVAMLSTGLIVVTSSSQNSIVWVSAKGDEIGISP
jgi:hypothetical protein